MREPAVRQETQGPCTFGNLLCKNLEVDIKSATFAKNRNKKSFVLSFQLHSEKSSGSRRTSAVNAPKSVRGMNDEQSANPVIAVINSFTESIPGHTHLRDVGLQIKREIEALGGLTADFNPVAVDGEGIAGSVEKMVKTRRVNAMVCISGCDNVTHGMLMAAIRLNIPTIFVSGGPAEAESYPACYSCLSVATTNSMNSLNEALGFALPGNGTVVAGHANRRRLYAEAARLIVRNATAHYCNGDESTLPRSIFTRSALLNAMTLDIAMGGPTDSALRLLDIARQAGMELTTTDINALHQRTPVLCKVTPDSRYHIADVNRAGGILSIMKILADAGLIDTSAKRVDFPTLADALERWAVNGDRFDCRAENLWLSAPAGRHAPAGVPQWARYFELDLDRSGGCIRDIAHAYPASTAI